MEKLFVTRADSMIGANAAAALTGRCDVVSAPITSSLEATLETVRRERPDWVLHSGPAAWSSWDLAGIDGVRSSGVADLAQDAAFATAVSQACRDVGAKFVAVTSDAVFCGPRMFHDEHGTSRARTPWAKQLAALETALCSSGALVLRSHVYGWTAQGGATNYAERMFHSLTAELPCRVDARRHATPILVTDFIGFAFTACRAGLEGVIHLTGAERTSPHRFAAELAATLSVPGRNVRLEPMDEKADAQRREETSLHIGLIRHRLNLALPMLREGLSRFVDQGFNGYRQRLGGVVAADVMSTTANTLQAA